MLENGREKRSPRPTGAWRDICYVISWDGSEAFIHPVVRNGLHEGFYELGGYARVSKRYAAISSRSSYDLIWLLLSTVIHGVGAESDKISSVVGLREDEKSQCAATWSRYRGGHVQTKASLMHVKMYNIISL